MKGEKYTWKDQDLGDNYTFQTGRERDREKSIPFVTGRPGSSNVSRDFRLKNAFHGNERTRWIFAFQAPAYSTRPFPLVPFEGEEKRGKMENCMVVGGSVIHGDTEVSGEIETRNKKFRRDENIFGSNEHERHINKNNTRNIILETR